MTVSLVNDRIATSSSASKALLKYEIAGMKARGLAKVDGAVSNTNSYVLVKWNGRDLGRSAVFPKN